MTPPEPFLNCHWRHQYVSAKYHLNSKFSSPWASPKTVEDKRKKGGNPYGDPVWGWGAPITVILTGLFTVTLHQYIKDSQQPRSAHKKEAKATWSTNNRNERKQVNKQRQLDYSLSKWNCDIPSRCVYCLCYINRIVYPVLVNVFRQ